MDTYEDLYYKMIDGFKPQFGNENHIKAGELIAKIADGFINDKDIEQCKRQIIYLIKQK